MQNISRCESRVNDKAVIFLQWESAVEVKHSFAVVKEKWGKDSILAPNADWMTYDLATAVAAGATTGGAASVATLRTATARATTGVGAAEATAGTTARTLRSGVGR
jgi:hypothetical protein